MIGRSLAISAWLIGCAGKSPAPVAHDPPDQSAPAGSRATSAFRAFTASRLHVAPEEVLDASHILEGKHTRGAAQAYLMTYARDGRRAARGWATPDGTVITPNQNLGRLFAEAGTWTRPPIHKPGELETLLAQDIAWAYGEYDTVEVSHGAAPPRLVLAADGSGSFRFFSRSQNGAVEFDAQFEADLGGPGGGYADFYFEMDVVLTADHKATLTRKPFELQSAP